jgi:hypothetical protein
LNLGDTWGTFTGSVDEDELSILLADGTYVADDNDEFDYEQKITLGAPTLTHFRDTDYSTTPTVGFRLASNTFVLNYTLDFTTDAESDVTSNDMEDITGSDLLLMGKTYYVSSLLNGTNANYFNKLILLDSATTGTVSEGETVTVTDAGTTYEVSMSYIDNDEVKFVVNGETAPKSGKLNSGDSYKLADGSYIGVKDISKLEVSGETGSVVFSIGSGKLEFTSSQTVKLNDDTITGLKGYVHRGSASSGAETVDKIVIEWKTDDEVFLTPQSDLLMPGFETLKFTMNEFVRPLEEKITIDADGDDSIDIKLPIEDGEVSFNILYSNVSGELNGTGKDSENQLLTSDGNSIVFIEKNEDGGDEHAYFIATYNITQEAESYLLRAKITTTDARNETRIEKKVGDSWVNACGEERAASTTCDIGQVSLNIGTVAYKSGDNGGENVTITAGTNVNFNSVFTKGGLKIYLPWETSSTGDMTKLGAINLSNDTTTAGHSRASFHLTFDGEDKDDNIGSGSQFNVTIDDTTSGTIKLYITQVNEAGSGGANGRRVDQNIYETYIVDPVAPRIVHYTSEDDDYVEIYYPYESGSLAPGADGNSESFAEVYLTEYAASGGGGVGSMVFTDAEKVSWQNRNVILIGGSCINSATATALGVATGTCDAAFTSATGVGSGQYLIQSVGSAFTSGKIALVVAGYNKADTSAAASRLVNQPSTIDTTAGNKYLGVVGVEGTSTISKVA